MRYLILFVIIAVISGCLTPEQKREQEEDLKKAHEGPCMEQTFRKDKYMKATCVNKNHKLIMDGEWIICKCRNKENGNED